MSIYFYQFIVMKIMKGFRNTAWIKTTETAKESKDWHLHVLWGAFLYIVGGVAGA